MYKNYSKKIICLFLLIVSMQSSELSIAQELISQTDVITISKQDFSDLTMALLHEDYPTAKTLINEGAVIGKDDKHIIGGPFLEWAMSSDESGLIRLLDEMKWIDTSRVFSDGTTILHSAVYYNAHSVLRYLVAQRKVNLNRQRIFARHEDDRIGFTALHYAVVFDDQLAAHILIQAGADITIKDEGGDTVADYAINSEMAKLFCVQCNQSDEKTGLQEIEKNLVDEQKNAEMNLDLEAAFYHNNSYPFLEESFAVFGKDFKSIILQLIHEQVDNNDFDDFASAFDSCISKAENELAQSLAFRLNIQSINSVMQDPALKSIMNNPCVLELALRKDEYKLLKKFLAESCSNKVLKSLFVDTGFIYSLPVLYHATNLDTLKFLIDHGAGEKESPKNFDAYVYTKKLPKEELQKALQIDNSHVINDYIKEIDQNLDRILLYQSMLTLGLDYSIKDKDYKNRKMDAIILEAKKTSKTEVCSYLKDRSEQIIDRAERVRFLIEPSFAIFSSPLLLIPSLLSNKNINRKSIILALGSPLACVILNKIILFYID